MNIILSRLENQLLINPPSHKPGDTLRHMLCMQAQNFMMSKWGIGIRAPGITENDVDDSIVRGYILRTHLLRPTWHLVSNEDINWLTHLSAPYIGKALRHGQKRLGLTSEVLTQCLDIISEAVEGEESLPRMFFEDLMIMNGIEMADNRLSHILMAAELERIITSGYPDGNNATYGSYDIRVKTKTRYPEEEALAELAYRYFRSRGPALLDDFIWWSGLTKTKAKQALESVKSKLNCVKVNGLEYLFADKPGDININSIPVITLPAFDEYVIAYKDRSLLLPPGTSSRVVSVNGMFYPVVLVNGIAAGTWKRTFKSNGLIIETDYFATVPENKKEKISEAFRSFADFLEKQEMEIRQS